ncbi:hypothetical protein LPJ61_000514 [Coemansia biformis]|uniref:Uncharacterized protein n=1 Tax=Coemansia biformis TaxID=1286918 RepID=A0A9W7YIH8_9FUNG|nr:hypothetical protein LPJ61_000514 [Coemansia biformis]
MAQPLYDNSDTSVAGKAGMALGRSPSGLRLPGIDATTRGEATRLCARDFLEHHVFFNDRGFHNHLNHHLLAVFAMGASAERMQTIFDLNKTMQRSQAAYNDGADITAENYTEYLGTERCYAGYIQFFRSELDSAGDGWKTRALDYFFSPNLFPLGMDGLFHPFIQMGYGLEFDSKAITAMALAQICVHHRRFETIFSEETFAEICANTPINDGSGLSLMQIFDMARKDPLAADSTFSEQPFLRNNTTKAEALTAKYAKAWAVPATREAVDAKCAELLSMLALFYGAITRPGYKPLLHFIVMHCLTSAYFLPIFFDHLSLERQAVLLKAHLAVSLSVFAILGTPEFHATPELVTTDTHSIRPDTWARSENGWLDVFAKAIASNDIHVPKVVRSLWRGSLLDTQESVAKGYELPPPINWLHLARLTIDTITVSPFEDQSAQIQAGKRPWAFGMVGFDEFWANYARE